MNSSPTPPIGESPGGGEIQQSLSSESSASPLIDDSVIEHQATSSSEQRGEARDEEMRPRGPPEEQPSSSLLPSSSSSSSSSPPLPPPRQTRMGQAMVALLQSFATLPPGGGASDSQTVPQIAAHAPGTSADAALPPSTSQSQSADHPNSAPAVNPTAQPWRTLTMLPDARPVIFRPPQNAEDYHRVFADLIRSEGTEAAVSHHQLQAYQERNPTPGHHPIAGPPVAGVATLDHTQSQSGTDSQGGAQEADHARGEGTTDQNRVGYSRQSGERSPPTNMYYQLPFYALDGRQALLALPTLFLPRQVVSPTIATLLVPANPIYLPRSSSHLPFPVLLDGNGMAWPILDLQNPPPGTPDVYLNDARRPHFIAGTPFLSAGLRVSIAPETQEASRSSPEKAKAFVDTLETADAELRERMARLSIGDIGVFSGSGGAAAGTGVGQAQEGELGCPVCLDPYDESSDRPEWLGGEEARENQVVVIPCPGFHSMHRKCLVEWLGSRAPSMWSCPMCRTSISPRDVVKGSRSQQQQHQQQERQRQRQTAPTQASLAREIEARSHTLREEIHRRERQIGFTCDYQACLPDYEAPLSNSNEEGSSDRQMIKLQPCGHELHLDCLTTALRVENDLKIGDDGMLEDDEEEEEEEDDEEGSLVRTRMVGKWVTCPVDKREVWAKIPVTRRKKQEQGGSEHEKSLPGDGEGRETRAAADKKEQQEENATSGCGQIHRLSHSPSDMPGAKRKLLGSSPLSQMGEEEAEELLGVDVPSSGGR